MDPEVTTTTPAADTTQAAGSTTTTSDAAAVSTAAAATTVVTGEAAKPAEAAPKAEDKPATDADKKVDERPLGAPEAYADFAAPEGLELDAEVLGDLKSVAKELNLPQEAAQRIVDLGVKLQQRSTEAWKAQTQQWAADVRNDKEIGGEKLAENLAVVKKVMTTFSSPAFDALLDSTGLGNHPELVKTFHRIGKAISEDGFVPGGRAGTDNGAQRLFAASNMNP